MSLHTWPYRLVSAISAAAVLSTVLVSGTATASADFYTPPSPLPAGPNGEVIKTLRSTYGHATSTRIMYLSRNVRNQPIAVTGTVLVPTSPWTGSGDRPIVAYAPFTSGLGDQCAPSKSLAGEGGDLTSTFHPLFVNALLGKGFAVAQTDYEGLGTPGEHPYVNRESEAHTVLDVLRAARGLPGSGLAADAPVGIAGYSQGGGASAAAVELAPTYAPELAIAGAYVGAPPADKAVLADSLDRTFYAGLLAYALSGLIAAYPEAGILDLANDKGRKVIADIRRACTVGGTATNLFRDTRDLTLDGRPLRAYLDEEPFRGLIADNRIGTRTPTAPVLIEHALFDDIIPYRIGKRLGRDWCAAGATVRFRTQATLPVVGHITGGGLGVGHAADWLADRFAGRTESGNCGF